jgi:hypothetical protein
LENSCDDSVTKRLAKIAERISKSQLNILGCYKSKHINCGFIKNVQTKYIKGSRINYNAYRNKTQLMETIRTWDSMIHVRNKQQKNLKGKIAKFATKDKNKIIRGLYRRNNEYEKVYRLKTNLVKNEKGNFWQNTILF